MGVQSQGVPYTQRPSNSTVGSPNQSCLVHQRRKEPYDYDGFFCHGEVFSGPSTYRNPLAHVLTRMAAW